MLLCDQIAMYDAKLKVIIFELNSSKSTVPFQDLNRTTKFVEPVESPRSSYNESIVQSPDANEYFGQWDSRSPSPKSPAVVMEQERYLK